MGRDAKILDIFGGQQIQLLVVARRLLGLSSSQLEVTGCGAHGKIRFGTPDLPHQRQPDPSQQALHVLQEAGAVDEAGEITASGANDCSPPAATTSCDGLPKDCSGDTLRLPSAGGIQSYTQEVVQRHTATGRRGHRSSTASTVTASSTLNMP